MAKINARNKGKVGEREAAAYLRKLGFDSAERNGQQFKGGYEAADVACAKELPGLRIEVKRNEAMTVGSAALMKAYEQARRDAGERKMPCVLWRVNRGRWMLTLETDQPVLLATVSGDEEIRHALLFLQRAAEEELVDDRQG